VYIVDAEYIDVKRDCDHSSHSTRLKSKLIEMKDWVILDAPRWGRDPVLIRLLVPSLACTKCGPFPDPRPGWLVVPPRSARAKRSERRIFRTDRLNQYVLDRLSDIVTFEQIGRETLLNERTIRTIFFEEFKPSDQSRSMDLPVHMGIDEAWYLVDRKRQYVTLIIDHDSGSVVDILEDRKTSTLVRRFYAASNRQNVKVLTMDMLEQFYSAAKQPHKLDTEEKGLSEEEREDVKQLSLYFAEGDMAQFVQTRRNGSPGLPEALPNAQVIVDHFHLSKAISDAFTDARRAVQKKIDQQVRKDPKGVLGSRAMELMKKEVDAAASEGKGKKGKPKTPAAWLKSKRFILSRRKRKYKGPEDQLIVDVFLAQDSLLKAAWDLKEEGLAIFDEPRSPDDVRSKLQDWIDKVQKSDAREHYQPVVKTIKKWNDAIFAIPGSKYDNARTEAKVGFMKLRRALGRGVFFETIRALMIWGDAHRRRRVFPEGFEAKRTTIDRLVQWIDQNEVRLTTLYPVREPR
jgi:transposase